MINLPAGRAYSGKPAEGEQEAGGVMRNHYTISCNLIIFTQR